MGTAADMDPALMTAWATVAIAASTVVVGGGTCFLIWRGLKAMDRSSDERARDRWVAADELKAWREADIRRHEKAMAALRESIVRTSPVVPAK